MIEMDANTYIDNALKPPKKFFEWCVSHITNFKWKNKNETIIASNRSKCPTLEKRLTKNSRLTFFDKYYSFAIILVSSKRIEIQTYSFFSEVTEGKQTVECYLDNFEQFSNDKHVKVTSSYGRRGYHFGSTSNYGGWTGAYTGTKFYPNNWKERVKDVSELRYLSFDKATVLSIYHIENIYKYRQEIEFLQKINAHVLADEVMFPKYTYSGTSERKCVDMRVITPRWLKQNKQFFKNSSRSFNEYEFERRVRQRGGKIVEGIGEYINYRDINKIPKGIGLIRFQKWIIKNKINFNYYLDYLSVLRDLNINPENDENLIIPKDLKAAHDNAVNLLNQMKIEADEGQYKKRLPKITKYETEIDGYSFVVPKKMNDLIIEGKKLHHCVGSSSYVKGHSKGTTTIIFVRNSNEPDEPFFTLEYRAKQIIQIRGKHNQSPSDEIRAAVDKWLKWVNGGCKRGENKVKNQKEKASAA